MDRLSFPEAALQLPVCTSSLHLSAQPPSPLPSGCHRFVPWFCEAATATSRLAQGSERQLLPSVTSLSPKFTRRSPSLACADSLAGVSSYLRSRSHTAAGRDSPLFIFQGNGLITLPHATRRTLERNQRPLLHTLFSSLRFSEGMPRPPVRRSDPFFFFWKETGYKLLVSK